MDATSGPPNYSAFSKCSIRIGCGPPDTVHWPWSTGHRPMVIDHRTWSTSRDLLVRGQGLWSTGHGPPDTVHRTRAIGHRPRASGHSLPDMVLVHWTWSTGHGTLATGQRPWTTRRGSTRHGPPVSCHSPLSWSTSPPARVGWWTGCGRGLGTSRLTDPTRSWSSQTRRARTGQWVQTRSESERRWSDRQIVCRDLLEIIYLFHLQVTSHVGQISIKCFNCHLLQGASCFEYGRCKIYFDK